MSDAGDYGDYVCEVDWCVGQVLDALERTGRSDNTLLIFTSYNGPENSAYEPIQQHAHYSMGDLRGIKRDAWEGGHRVPFMARWPGVVDAGATCAHLTTLGGLLATAAEVAQTEVPDGAGEDSVSILPLLHGAGPVRSCEAHHSMKGKFALRRGDLVFIDAPSGDDNAEPDWFKAERWYEPHDCRANSMTCGTTCRNDATATWSTRTLCGTCSNSLSASNSAATRALEGKTNETRPADNLSHAGPCAAHRHHRCWRHRPRRAPACLPTGWL
jgi:hypothetical protein